MSIIILWILYRMNAPFYMYVLWTLCYAVQIIIRQMEKAKDDH